ncbi:MAG: hypothetical protein ACOC4M_03845 [Promethearchaeia archaeon]
MVIGLVTYILSILGRNCPFIGVNGNFFELIVFLTYAIVPPGIIVNILYYIKNYSNQYIDKTYGDSWHIHESFLGLLLISGGALLIISNLYMNKFQVFQKQLSFILSITGVFLYFFLFLGGFLIARDWNDVIQLKFIEKKSNAHHLRKKGESLSCEVFNQISKEDLEFFESPRYQIYPIGVILTTISLSFIIYNQSLLPSEIFFISPQMVTIMGYIGGFIAGFILGVDWLRLFGKFYPQVNRNLDKIIEILKR